MRATHANTPSRAISNPFSSSRSRFFANNSPGLMNYFGPPKFLPANALRPRVQGRLADCLAARPSCVHLTVDGPDLKFSLGRQAKLRSLDGVDGLVVKFSLGRQAKLRLPDRVDGPDLKFSLGRRQAKL